MPHLSIRFDLRVPPFVRESGKTSFAGQHRAMLEMVDWAESAGFAEVVLSEHHGDPAGFSSAPLTLAAAILGRTGRIAVQISAALAPLHDPVRFAEQVATIDCLAPGRLSLVMGAGYRRAEFAMAGIPREERGARLEASVRILREAWSGEPFIWEGRELQVTPPGATPGGPGLTIGGKTRAGARRAARLRCHFSPAVSDPEVIACYFEEAERQGFDDAEVYGAKSLEAWRARQDHTAASAPGFVMVSDDPEATWREIGPHAEYDALTYAAWQDDGVVSDWAVPEAADWQALRESGNFAVVTPDECVALAERDGRLMLHPLMGGIPPALAWTGLRRFEQAVLPRLARD